MPLDHKKKGIRQREGEENYGRKLGEEVDLINEKGTRMGWGVGGFPRIELKKGGLSGFIAR